MNHCILHLQLILVSYINHAQLKMKKEIVRLLIRGK